MSEFSCRSKRSGRAARLCLPAALLGALAATAPAAADWEFSITPYLWLPGLKGDVIAFPGRPPVGVDADFGDLFDRLTGAFMMKAEISNGRFSLLGDIDYLGIERAEQLVVQGVPLAGAAMDASTLDGTLALGYRVHDGERLDLDLVGGARYTSVEIDITAQLGPRAFSGGQDEQWVDPIIGLRGIYDIGGRSSVTFYGDVGGFGVSSDSVWQAYVGYNYRLTRMITASVGYRHYTVDFDGGDNFLYAVELGGPLVGLRFGF